MSDAIAQDEAHTVESAFGTRLTCLFLDNFAKAAYRSALGSSADGGRAFSRDWSVCTVQVYEREPPCELPLRFEWPTYAALEVETTAYLQNVPASVYTELDDQTYLMNIVGRGTMEVPITPPPAEQCTPHRTHGYEISSLSFSSNATLFQFIGSQLRTFHTHAPHTLAILQLDITPLRSLLHAVYGGPVRAFGTNGHLPYPFPLFSQWHLAKQLLNSLLRYPPHSCVLQSLYWAACPGDKSIPFRMHMGPLASLGVIFSESLASQPAFIRTLRDSNKRGARVLLETFAFVNMARELLFIIRCPGKLDRILELNDVLCAYFTHYAPGCGYHPVMVAWGAFARCLLRTYPSLRTLLDTSTTLLWEEGGERLLGRLAQYTDKQPTKNADVRLMAKKFRAMSGQNLPEHVRQTSHTRSGDKWTWSLDLKQRVDEWLVYMMEWVDEDFYECETSKSDGKRFTRLKTVELCEWPAATLRDEMQSVLDKSEESLRLLLNPPKNKTAAELSVEPASL